MRAIDVAERRARLGCRHLVGVRTGDLDRAVETMVGLHSSDPCSVFLAARARVRGFTVSDLESRLYDARGLLRVLGMRRTMFVVTRPDAALLEAACSRAYVARERRRLERLVAEEGLADHAEPWLADVCDRTVAAIAARGEALAIDLRDDVPELACKLSFGHGKTWAGAVGLSTRVLFLLATEARIVRTRPRGSWASSQYRWAVLGDWVGESPETWDPRAARAELVRRWLTTFGPGTMRDVTWWTGWSKRDALAALAAGGAVEVDLDGVGGFVLAGDCETTPDPEPWVAFLPGLDPTPMGWKDRDWFVGPHAERIFDRNGNIGPTIWSDGRIVGGWAQGDDGRVRTGLLEDLTPDEQRRIAAEASALEDWLDGVRVLPRFPTPLDRELSSA